MLYNYCKKEVVIIAIVFSKKGEYHKVNNLENGDATYTMENEHFVIAVVADGATGCANGHVGAKLACQTIGKYIAEIGEEIFDMEIKKIAYLILEQLKFVIKENCYKETSVYEYGSTIVFFMGSKKTKKTILFNLGDGAIIGTHKNNYTTLLMPQKQYGGCVLSTTENAYRTCEIMKRTVDQFDVVIICTDGFYNLMLENELRETIFNNICSKKYNELMNDIEKMKAADDCTFIVVNM